MSSEREPKFEDNGAAAGPEGNRLELDEVVAREEVVFVFSSPVFLALFWPLPRDILSSVLRVGQGG